MGNRHCRQTVEGQLDGSTTGEPPSANEAPDECGEAAIETAPTAPGPRDDPPPPHTNKQAGLPVGDGSGVLAAALELVPTEQLRLSTRNPRRGNIGAIRTSLEANGQYRPLIVNRATGEVLAGNHTLLAARELGLPQLAAYLIDVDDEHALRILLADNRTADLAGYDQGELAALLSSLAAVDASGLAGSGYSQADLDRLLDELDPGLPIADDDVPPLPSEPRTRPGDLIELGEHRLLCGDATDPSSFERLLAGEQAELLLADPPYGVGYTGKTPAALRIRNDSLSGLDALLTSVFANAAAVLSGGAPVYVFHPSGPQGLVFVSAFLAQGWQLRQGLVWAKDSLVLGHADYHYGHEPILYGFTPGEGRLGRGGHGWFGDNSQTSLLEVPRPQASREHPTMKPIELVARLIRNSSRRRGLVLDPFAGSGSSLLACEHLGRRSRLIELDPRYCDVIVNRYERTTGKASTRRRR